MEYILGSSSVQLLLLIAGLISGYTAIDYIKEKHKKGRKFSLLSDFENTFKATYRLIFHPTYCFNRNDENLVLCSNLKAFKYWFYITLLTYVIILFSSKNPEHYGFLFFLTSFLYSFAKIACTAVAYYVAAMLFQKDEAENISSIVVFTVGLSSLAIYTITLIPNIYSLGFDRYVENNQWSETIKSHPEVILLPSIIVLVFMYTYIKNHCIFNRMKTILIIVTGGVIYLPLKILILMPLGGFVTNILLDPPWAK